MTGDSGAVPGRTAVVGAGVIGAAVAWRLARQGAPVTVYEDAPGATPVAAGLIAPVSEAYFGESTLTGLLMASAARWDGFAEALSADCAAADADPDLGYRTDGTLLTALTNDDYAEARRLWRYQEELGLPVTQLRGDALRAREPVLHPRVRGGAAVASDRQVDPRRLLPALRAAASAAGARFVTRRVGTLRELAAEPEVATVVVAAGCGAAALTGLPVRPVKGELLRLRAPGDTPGFRHVVRGYADGRRVYVVPRADGEVVVGATEQERTDDVPTAGGVLELLRAACDLVPELTEYGLTEVTVGHRPGTPDNAPLLGLLPPAVVGFDTPRVVVATGHYRHGVLAAPVTADAVSTVVTTGACPEWLAPFDPARFAADGTEGRSMPW